jgi:3-oxoacyl-(acyl-carrier-protein) synthase
MNHGFVPANLRWEQPAEGLIMPVTQTLHQPVHHVLCNAFGFGGNESSLVLSDHGIELSEANLEEPVLVQTTDEQMVTESLVTASEARRMTPQMRQLVSLARKALDDAGIGQPDAIVCATQWGCMVQSMRFLQDMIVSGEQELKPTPFIQSTHNTVASLMAILTGNHGYNATYSQGEQSLSCALTDVRTQISLGLIGTALILEFDEQVEAWDKVLQLINEHTENIARASIYTL